MFCCAKVVFYLCTRKPRGLQSIPFAGLWISTLISISTFVDSRKTPRGFARGFRPSLFVILPCRAV